MNTSALAQWFINNFSFTTEQIKQWFTFDAQHPMLFNSSLFLGLFLVFYCVYIITKKYAHFRTVYVTLFSLFFYYKAGGNYFVLLILSSLMDYYFAGRIHRSQHPATRKLFLAISMVTNLGILGYFKYTKKKFGEGRRIFLMSPLHHHYQKKGYHESKIVMRFLIVGIILALVSFITLKIR